MKISMTSKYLVNMIVYWSMYDYDFQERVTAERLKAYHEKKSKKPALIAKTSVLLDIKPWDDETDMNEMLKSAKSIEKEGLVWGACKSQLIRIVEYRIYLNMQWFYYS